MILDTFKEVAWPGDTQIVQYFLGDTHLSELGKDYVCHVKVTVRIVRPSLLLSPAPVRTDNANGRPVVRWTEAISPPGVYQCLHGVGAGLCAGNSSRVAVQPEIAALLQEPAEILDVSSIVRVVQLDPLGLDTFLLKNG